MVEKNEDKWRFLKAVIYTGQDLKNDSEFETEYNPWFINRALSYYKDTISIADLANRLVLNKKDHFDYVFYSVPKRKRFTKMYYSSKDDIISIVMEYYQCNEKKAKEYLELLVLSDKLRFVKNFKGGEIK